MRQDVLTRMPSGVGLGRDKSMLRARLVEEAGALTRHGQRGEGR